MRSFDSLSEREILSLAVALEEEDERIYGDFADGLRENYPGGPPHQSACDHSPGKTDRWLRSYAGP